MVVAHSDGIRLSLALAIVCGIACASPRTPTPSAGLGTPSSRLSSDSLRKITYRGRQLAAYDVAAWHATDAVRVKSPVDGSVAGYVARETPEGWEVAFGTPSSQRDTFSITYLARQRSKPEDFAVNSLSPPVIDTDYYARAFRASRVALQAFGTPQRPYNIAVLPADSSGWWVYLTPAVTVAGVWPLGADVRFRLDSSGQRILERRQLHKSVIEYDGRTSSPVHGMHTAILADSPEDTDVMTVLRRQPRIPEFVVSKSFIFVIDTVGQITAYVR